MNRYVEIWDVCVCAFSPAAQTSQTHWGAAELLNITVGTQSISPLYWAIESGSLNTAKAMLEEKVEIQTEMDGKERPKCICSNLINRLLEHSAFVLGVLAVQESW